MNRDAGIDAVTARFVLPRRGPDKHEGFTLDVAFTAPARGVTAVFGPSGSGKTTLLRCMAGLERPRASELHVRGVAWQDARHFLPAHRRPVGYVFQEANLFPHLDVKGNLDFAARRAAASEAINPGFAADPGLATAPRREAIVELLGIGHLLDRGVQALSGGERQRVAIARALLTRPQLLLLDEPLAALERERKRDILPYLERLRDELAIPMLYVTHAVDEVLRLADHLLLLEAGRIRASGPLAELAARLDLPLAQDPDGAAVIEATVGKHDFPHHLTRLDFAGGSLHASMGDIPRAPEVGRKVRVCVQARDVSIALSEARDSSILNRLPAVIVSLADAPHPGQCLVRLDLAGTALLARISMRSREELALAEGQSVWVQIKSVALLEP